MQSCADFATKMICGGSYTSKGGLEYQFDYDKNVLIQDEYRKTAAGMEYVIVTPFREMPEAVTYEILNINGWDMDKKSDLWAKVDDIFRLWLKKFSDKERNTNTFKKVAFIAHAGFCDWAYQQMTEKTEKNDEQN